MAQPTNTHATNDMVGIREDLAEILRHEGYPVATAPNGQEALAQLSDPGGQALPGLILLDLMMPVKNGWDFRAELLQRARDHLPAELTLVPLQRAAATSGAGRSAAR